MRASVRDIRAQGAAVAALLCALFACMALAATPAAADEGDVAPIRPMSEGGLSIPEITGPTAPEEYPLQYGELSPELKLRQVSDQSIVAEYFKYGVEAFSINAEAAHAVDGATVPTEIRLSEDEEGPVITLIVHHRAGNPAAGGAPFKYPISGGQGWAGGIYAHMFEMNEPAPPPAEPTPTTEPPAACVVPSLHGLSLKLAKTHLRAARCAIGDVHLATGAKAATGKVTKQFRAAGTELAAGAPVAIKLGSH